MGAITTKADERINQGKKTVQEAFSLMIQKNSSIKSIKSQNK